MMYYGISDCNSALPFVSSLFGIYTFLRVPYHITADVRKFTVTLVICDYPVYDGLAGKCIEFVRLSLQKWQIFVSFHDSYLPTY